MNILMFAQDIMFDDLKHINGIRKETNIDFSITSPHFCIPLASQYISLLPTIAAELSHIFDFHVGLDFLDVQGQETAFISFGTSAL